MKTGTLKRFVAPPTIELQTTAVRTTARKETQSGSSVFVISVAPTSCATPAAAPREKSIPPCAYTKAAPTQMIVNETHWLMRFSILEGLMIFPCVITTKKKNIKINPANGRTVLTMLLILAFWSSLA
jgi:hypothetical protein